MRKYLGAFMLTAVLAMPAVSVLRADDDRDDHPKRYYDDERRDWHQWNANEDRAWHHYWEERHEAYVDWDRANKEQRRAYWKWRHEHPHVVVEPEPR